MTYTIGKRTFEVKETNGRFFYWGMARRWLPVKKELVTFADGGQ